MVDVHLHVGLPKTGTSAIQRALDAAADELARDGLLVVGGSHLAQRRAVYDLTGRRIDGSHNASVAGSWRRLVEQIDAWSGSSAVVSEELLALARPRQVATVARNLAGHRLFLVLTLRDIGRVLPSAWQQEIRKGRWFTWAQFMASVRDPSRGPATAGIPFWLRQDPLRVLEVWQRHIPPDRIRLVTVPQGGGAPTQLLDRFAEAVGLAPGDLPISGQANESLGAVEVEVVRRLNESLQAAPSQRPNLDLIHRGLIPSLVVHGSRPLTLPSDQLDWAQAYSQDLVTQLGAGGYRVFGDLAELVPTKVHPEQRRLDDVRDDELLDATEVALHGLGEQYLRIRRRRAAALATGAPGASRRQQLTSQARAKGFQLRLAGLERADRNRLLRWLSLRWTRRSGLPGPSDGSPAGSA